MGFCFKFAFIIIMETGWDLGLLLPGSNACTWTRFFSEQRNTEKLYGTKNNCLHAAVVANYGPKRCKKKKRNNNKSTLTATFEELGAKSGKVK